MSRILVPIAAAALAATLVSGIANAGGFIDTSELPKKNSTVSSQGPSSVPELTIGAAGGAFVMVAGATLIALGRRRRSQKRQ